MMNKTYLESSIWRLLTIQMFIDDSMKNIWDFENIDQSLEFWRELLFLSLIGKNSLLYEMSNIKQL